ncbi:hypothetical protein Tsubulata_035962, partial [Turnera subulata]
DLFPLIISSLYKVSKPRLLLSVLLTLFLIFPIESKAATNTSKVTSIGAIVDVNSRIGKEEKTAMEIAVSNFNNKSRNHKLSLHFQHPGGDPLQAAYAAEKLIKENEVKMIIGMDTWGEVALVADIGSKAQVPVLSFAEPAITPQLAPLRWPFLIRMASDGSEQMKCIAALVDSYSWRRVIVIYEDDAHGGEYGNLALLSEKLLEVGSEIEYRLVLPQFFLLSNPREVVQEELIKLQRETQSRVFIVLRSTLPMLTHLFREANEMGLVGRDAAWIVSNTITSFLDSLDSTIISSMEGTIGIKTYYTATGDSYKSFEAQFRKIFRSQYQEEDDFQPGISALRAYDSISIASQAMDRMKSDSVSPKELLQRLLISNFTGLSGKIHFNSGKLSHDPVLRIVNVIGKKYKELDFWLPNFGFSKTLAAFQKGSPMAADFSKAFLRLSESGKLKELEQWWFDPSPECSSSKPDSNIGSLGLRNLKGPLITTFGASTILLLIFLFRLVMKDRHGNEVGVVRHFNRSRHNTAIVVTRSKTFPGPALSSHA